MAIVRKYKSIVTDFINPAPGLYQVKFSPLSGKYTFRPGQFLHLALDEYNPSMQWPESRCFSMQSNPKDEKLRITFAEKGNFTRRMASELKLGKEVWLKMPYGDTFQRGHGTENCIFIAGGTGVTPFLSLFTDESFSDYKNPVLYVGYRSNKYNIFKKEIEKAKEINKGFEVNIVLQDKKGILDIEKIYMHNKKATFFISGPPAMIKNFRIFLHENSVNENKIVTDDWE